MMESLFGSAPAAWPGMTTSGFGWPATASPFVNRPIPTTGTLGTSAMRVPDPVSYGTPGAFGAVGYEVQTMPTAGSIIALVAARRGQLAGPSTDAELEDFLYDCLEFLPGTNEVEIRCESGRVLFSGTVPHRRQKRDIGEIAWNIPTVSDVQNNAAITARRRARPTGREAEPHQAASARKSA